MGPVGNHTQSGSPPCSLIITGAALCGRTHNGPLSIPLLVQLVHGCGLFSGGRAKHALCSHQASDNITPPCRGAA